MPAQLPASCNRMPSCAGALPPPSADDVLERATGASIEACCSKIARRLVHSRRELGSLLLHQHIDTPAAFHGPLQHCSNMPHIARDLIRLRPMPTCSVEATMPIVCARSWVACDSSHGLGFINQHIWYPDKCVNFVWYQYKQDTLFELLCCGKFPVELGSVTLKINNQQRERESNQAPHFVAVPSLVLNVRNGPLGLFVSYFCK